MSQVEAHLNGDGGRTQHRKSTRRYLHIFVITFVEATSSDVDSSAKIFPPFPAEFWELLEKSISQKNAENLEEAERYEREFAEHALSFLLENEHIWCRFLW